MNDDNSYTIAKHTINTLLYLSTSNLLLLVTVILTILGIT